MGTKSGFGNFSSSTALAAGFDFGFSADAGAPLDCEYCQN
jgi:hypothetical protein